MTSQKATGRDCARVLGGPQQTCPVMEPKKWKLRLWFFCFPFVPGILCWEVAFPFRSMYCKLSDSCACAFQAKLDSLELDLCRHVYGQHIAQEVIVGAIRKFAENQAPLKPLVLSFHGWSGTGKSYVTSLLMRNLYRKGMKSIYVHQFVPTLHFPHAGQLHLYKEQLKTWIASNLSDCSRSVFIFDEMDKMHPGLIDAIKPFLGNSHVMYGTNYRKAIFIFISNAGGEQINQMVLEFWKNGKDREDIQLEDLESHISSAVFRNKNSGFWNSDIIHEELVDYFVPFLPLKQKHVKECVKSEMLSRGINPRNEIITEVVNSMNFFPEDEKLFSQTGCKTVSTKLDFSL
ncbi:torsin-1A-like [Hypanus sabinus]|uniref:torsin-1A-like n=1 Tax=Hypanus sabinus TaxID=79690 RepID=UPI0028C41F7A|nr:torsin-1A-like [Hypanus sabinus]